MLLRHTAAAVITFGACVFGAPSAMAQSDVATDTATAPQNWREAVQAAVSQTSALHAFTPSDITTFCPNYSALDVTERDQFWTNLLTRLADEESGGDPDRTRWLPFDSVMHRPTFRRGLFQISIEAAQSSRYRCEAATNAELTSAAGNSECALKILVADTSVDGTLANAGHYWPTLGRAARRRKFVANIAAVAPCATGAQP